MGDYRNELQSALSQVEALRAENASLRMRLRAAGVAPRTDGLDGAEFEPPPVHDAAPAPRATRRQRATVAVAITVSLAGLGVASYAHTLRASRRAREERLSLPNLPEVRVGESPAPLPLPPTSVRISAPHAEPSVIEVRDTWIPQPPVAVDGFRSLGLRWPSDSRLGLYVLHTTPASRCSVGGVIVDAPAPAFITAGTHRVRCQVGRVRHVWDVRIEGRRVTFDTLHDVGAP